MQKIALAFAAAILLPMTTLAQGTLEVSNLGQNSTGSATIGSDSWIAQSIVTGTDPFGYTLNSVELLMNAASGNPAGFTVSVYSSLNFYPANDLGSLTGPAPLTGGTYSYSTTGISLSPSTAYFVVVTDANPVSQGAYNWIATSYAETVGAEYWTINDAYFSSPNGSSWTEYYRSDVFQMALYATPVPEPSAYALGGIGVLVLALRSRRNY